jgi:pimeloyl-ACP methyl ester carboxylesterase
MRIAVASCSIQLSVSVATAPSTTRPSPHAYDGYGSNGRAAWLDIDWREHQRWVMVDGRPVNVIEVGDGPPLVFVHGHAGSWQNWLENIPYFAASRRVVALDLPGFGYSPMPRGEISISGYAHTVATVCEQLEIDAAAVVGNSMGGFISAELAIQFPQLVERLVLSSAAGLSTRYLGLPVNWMRLRATLAVIRTTNPLFATPVRRAERMARRRRLRRFALGVVTRYPEQLSPQIAAAMIIGAGKPGVPDAARAIFSYDFRDRLPEIACPTLIIWGDRDWVVPEGADEYAELIPNARKLVFQDTGHVPMVERPARFNTAVDEFLAD